MKTLKREREITDKISAEECPNSLRKDPKQVSCNFKNKKVIKQFTLRRIRKKKQWIRVY